MANTAILWVTIFVVIMAMMTQADNSWGDMAYIRSKTNGRDYRVRNLPDKEGAVEVLARTHQRLMKACQILQERHPTDQRVIRLVDRFPNTSLAEADGSGKHTSYSVNKGEKIVLCLRSKDGSDRLVDENLLLFVALHEISHIMTKSVGHTTEFWGNFKFVLENCQQAGLYRCIDFSRDPKKYCGITVTNSPASCQA